MSYRVSQNSILESTAKNAQNRQCSRSIRVSTATYTRIAQLLSPTYLFCTITFTRRNFESNGTRIDRKWSIPLDSSTVSPRIRVPLGDSIIFTSSLLFWTIFSRFFRSHTTALRSRAKTAKNVPSFAFEFRKRLPSQPKRLIQVNLDSKRSYVQYNWTHRPPQFFISHLVRRNNTCAQN